MELNYKRKLDCIVDNMDVIVPDSHHYEFLNGKLMDRPNKKVKISLNARVEPFAYQNPEGFHDQFVETDVYRASYSCDGSMLLEDEVKSLAGGNSGRVTYLGNDDDMEDIPSTNEVIDSLRKVMLWMSAQEDHNSDHIEYLTNVERYALSKRDSYVQQRKITEYFIKNTD